MTQPASDIDSAVRSIAQHYSGKRGTWAYEAFDYINATFFSGDLPTPLIVWALTPHGGCIGMTRSSTSAPPTITLHPSLLGGVKENPWGIEGKLLGVTYAFDVLLHECVHVNVEYCMGGSTGETSHNCDEWVSEVNRIAPLVGLAGVHATRSKVKRIIVEDAPLTKRGKAQTKLARVSDGNVSFDAVSRFPHAVRKELGLLDYYETKQLPFDHSL